MSLSIEQVRALNALMVTPKRFILSRQLRGNRDKLITGNAIIEINNGHESLIERIDMRVIAKLERLGFIRKLENDSISGDLYAPSDKALNNKEIIRKSRSCNVELATKERLNIIAAKFGCRLEYHTVPKLFKLVRLDGKELSRPFIDVSANGVKVARIKDLSVDEWQIEIASAIMRSDVV